MEGWNPRQYWGFHTFHTFHTYLPRVCAYIRARAYAYVHPISGMEGMEGMEEARFYWLAAFHTLPYLG